tara:strand:+ start:1046 stop:1393 length:348 start_codon:yes stop_codon:yes gene_type:complete
MAKAKIKEPEVVSPEEMSKKDLENKRKEITAYYSENIPPLQVQLEYEELLRDIEKTRAERLQAQMFIAQTMAPEPEEGESRNDMPEMQSQTTIDPSKMSGQEAADHIKRTLKKSN